VGNVFYFSEKGVIFVAYMIGSEHGAASRENNIKGLRETPMRRAMRGSSLVEMLIAIFVLAIVLISMIGMFLISRTAVSSKEGETANALALRLLEETESRPYSDFLVTATPPEFELLNLNEKPYKATVYVTSADKYSAIVRVKVEWSGAARGLNKIGNAELTRVISAGGRKNVGEQN
jgi:Tfp pilus assembly protein PilV